MANKKTNNGSSIVTDSENIVCHERKVEISDEKLKSLLMRSYETARKDARSFKFYKLHNVFLSIASTLFITLLTSDFKSFDAIQSSTISTIAWGVFVLCLLLGIITASVSGSKGNTNEAIERNQAVDTILSEIKDSK